jgi:hypothetical protein
VKEYKALVTSFVEVVTFLLASFGGFLKRIAPPDQVGASYAVGVSSFLMLVILMAISAIARIAPSRTTAKKWVIAGGVLFICALAPSFLYPYLLSRYTFPHQTELSKRQISAPDKYLTADARRYKATNPDATAEELSQNLPDGDVWTGEGVERMELQLLVAYTCLVLTLAGAVFCLLEANIRVEKVSKKLMATPADVK